MMAPVIEEPLTDTSAFNRGAMVSERLMPGHTEMATIFDFCDFSLTTGTVLALSSVLGTWPPDGRASRTRCKCRVNTAIRRARLPSRRKLEDVEGNGSNDGENVGTAAA